MSEKYLVIDISHLQSDHSSQICTAETSVLMNITRAPVIRKKHTPIIILLLLTFYLRIGLPKCCNCGSVVAEFWCKDCPDNYCAKCFTDGHSLPRLKLHQKVLMKDKPVELKRCKEHPDQRLRYWCSCEALICPDCQLSKRHKDHTPVLIKEIVEDITNKVCTQLFIR